MSPSVGQVAPAPRAALQRAQLDAGAPAVDRQSRSGRSRPSASSSTIICWRSISSRRACIELDARLAEIAETEPYRERVGWLRCFRGIDTLTAMLILAELHDFRRFQSPRALMAYLGLVPGEDSSGEKHRRGRITRTGNALVRRLLVETAWHYQHRPRDRRRPDAATQRPTRPGHRDRRQGAAATVSPLPTPDGTPQARAQGRRGDRARAGRLPLGGAPTGTGSGDVTSRDGDRRGVNGSMMRAGDGPRRRRMIRGTIVRIGELAMRYGLPSQLAPLDCTSSRRSTVMCALPRATAVTTVYQRDSSSKRPRSSVVSAARGATQARGYQEKETARGRRAPRAAIGV